jgi:methylated-DNA-[protein]-cysteine S-methyltransferase
MPLSKGPELAFLLQPLSFLSYSLEEVDGTVGAVGSLLFPQPTPFGRVGLVWEGTSGGPKVKRVLLPLDAGGRERDERAFFGLRRGSCPEIAELGRRIEGCLRGEAIPFDLGILALADSSDFQRAVLLAEAGIPRGWVSTYGRVARSAGFPGAGRAVGRALAENPFPIVIPCHRAVRADGDLGGFQGGRAMKRALLLLEEVAFTKTGKVAMERVQY